MVVKKFIFYILMISVVVFIFSQYVLAGKLESRSQQQRKEEKPGLTYEVEVRVTKIDIIVTDKAGKQVTGLKPENFQVYEDGRLQKLTNFFEVQGMEVYVATKDKESGKLEEPPEPQPESVSQVRNKVIIYFDNWQLHPMNRNWSIKKLESFIEKNFPPGTNNQGMVVCLDKKLEILQKFTSNPRLLILGVKEVKKRTGQSLLRRRSREELRKALNNIVSNTSQFDRYEAMDSYERALGQTRNYVEAEQADLVFSLKSLSAFVNNLSGMEGRKILVYVSDGLPINPGDEVFAFLDQAFPRQNARSEAMNYDATRIFKELTSRCNANEVTLYPINARGLETMTLSADTDAGWNVYNRGAGMVRPGSRTQNEALELMAQDTGGVAITSTNDIEMGLEQIKNDLQFYYTLGYRSLYQDDNKYHSLKVKLVGLKEDYNVRVRQGFKQISQEERIKESVTSHLFLKRHYNPMGVRVQVLPVEGMVISNNLRLTFKLLLPLKNLVLNPRKRDYLGQVKVYVILKDSEGRLSPIRELSEEIKIPAKDYDVAIKSYYPYLVEMYVKPGDYTVSFAVRDILAASTSYFQIDQTLSRPKDPRK